MSTKKKKDPMHEWSLKVGRALRRAAKRAREEARRYGTPIHFIRDGKIVSEKP